jgi:hypothetical protein
MSKKWISVLLAAVVGALVLAPSTAMAVCKVSVVSKISFTDSTTATTVTDPIPLTPGDKVSLVTVVSSAVATVNAEGITERITDVLITDDTVAPFCFLTGNNIVLTINAQLNDPTAASGGLTVPGNIDEYDSNGTSGVTVAQPTITNGFAANQPETVITIPILQTGTAGNLLVGPAGAALRIKNLRVDASKVSGAAINDTVNATAQVVAGNPFNVANKVATIGAAALASGTGTQSSGTTLGTAATFSFTEGFAPAFRIAGGTCNSSTLASDTCASQVANDRATTPTSLIFDLGTSIPSGVSVTFPATLSNSATAVGTAGASYTYALTGRGGSGSCTGSAACFVIYDTTGSGTQFTLNGTTGATANGLPTGAGNGSVVIGVNVASPSGFGTATIHASFGPGAAAGTGNDDVQPAAVPRYVANNIAGAPTRLIFTGNFFTINPVRTVLLYPFATTGGGFNTGIEVANTGADGAAFAPNATTAGQTGGLTFFFFNKAAGVAPNTFTLATDLSAGGVALPGCRGLDAGGRVAPGSVFACALNVLLTAAGQPAGFDGYVIVVSQFNLAHGFYATFNAAGAPFAANNALVLGSGARIGGTPEQLLQ